ncbi:DUF397 domain-containing protein [Streptomyces sp. cg35]|uniref:DUF397 domain-containing protein n=1 Tax=Streptomyces sp. cg35 TaxID=3421650 RepID=UPI003D168989
MSHDPANVPSDPARQATTGLYGAALVGPHTYLCNTDGSNTDMESCLGVAELVGGGYSVNGNKPEDSGRELRGTLAEMRGLFRQMQAIPEISGDATA